ncbi:MAG: flavin reductase [Clostridia bacterium]|nr:flavin reductase [Clostridia bacterium]
MYCTRKITDTLTWVGGNDRRLAMFEGVYSVPDGVSYNSYVLEDEKIAVFDTVDKAVSRVFFENLEHVLGDRQPDYLVVHHMEPDHAATMGEFVRRYPEAKIVCNAKIAGMIKQFFEFDIDSRAHIVNEGDVLELGAHKLTFVNAPMVHWPEVMMSYEMTDGILFSADAFGHFGALNGAIFADEVDFDRDYLEEARRYYTNIVGKYGTQVESVLKKAAGLDIKLLCPLHGFVWRENIRYFVEKYVKWATYTPEVSGVVIAYASVYGNTENAAEILSTMLREKGIKTVMFDVSVTPASEIISAIFKYSHVVFASTTYNAGIFVNMESLLYDVVAHNVKKRTVAFIENGSWAPASGKQMRELVSKIKDTAVIENTVTVRSAVKSNTLDELRALADAIEATLPVQSVAVGEIEKKAMFKLSYGLFALFTNDGKKDNACIINTTVQLTDTPKRITIAVNKDNYTCATIAKTGVFNLSVLDESATFDIFKRFGFASGRDTDKLDGFDAVAESANGLKYLTAQSNSYISAKVIYSRDFDTHTLFVADVTEARVLSDKPSVTYAYYFANIKPKAPVEKEAHTTEEKAEEKKIVGWRCKICGYEYEGAELPADFKCPWCKHPAEDFEPIYG